MGERRILIVTGAGVSRKLGTRGDIPLMGEWAAILRQACDAKEQGLADALRLTQDISAEDFEQVVGELLGLRADITLVKKYQGVGGRPGRPPDVRAVGGDAGRWIESLEGRLGVFEQVLRVTLYEQFGLPAISEQKAKAAVSVLLEAVLGDEGVQFATTNYDRSLEIGLAANNRSVNDGFKADTALATPKLVPDGMGNWVNEYDPTMSVLHLHGAVGWYARQDGEIVSQYADQPYNESLGTPAIVPPDPRKDPLNSPYVRAIWFEFRRVLAEATHVIVLGHSLHDAPLVGSLRELAGDARFAVSYHGEPQSAVTLGIRLPDDAGGFKWASLRNERGFDRALQFRLDFSASADLSMLEPWLQG
jgi:hypothetical protein